LLVVGAALPAGAEVSPPATTPPAAFAQCRPAQGTPASDPVALRMQSYAGAMFRERGISSVALVAKSGTIVLEQALGMASLEKKEAMRITHRFLVASLTKEWTAVATLLWAKQARVSLDATIGQWFPRVPAWRNIRLSWLLEHR
jgi:CubicO group peptidase (beta-lactamase class C family)